MYVRQVAGSPGSAFSQADHSWCATGLRFGDELDLGGF
jgi:hypothetical protein